LPGGVSLALQAGSRAASAFGSDLAGVIQRERLVQIEL